jgi:hypothetical protein
MVQSMILRMKASMEARKLQWLQDPSEINRDNLNNIRCETSRHFRTKMREYLKDKINEIVTNTKNKSIKTYKRNK